MKKLMKTSKIEFLLLKELHKIWQIQSDPTVYILAQSVWDQIYKKNKDKIDTATAGGVWNNLLNLKYIDAIQMKDGSIGIHLTLSGEDYYRKLKWERIKLIIEVCSVIIAAVGVIIALAKMWLDSINK
jgi:hypothetical protein